MPDYGFNTQLTPNIPQTNISDMINLARGVQGYQQSQQMNPLELQAKQQDSLLDAVNRKRDRESRERLAAIKLAEDMAKNPAGLSVVNQIVDPGMIQRLEANEDPLPNNEE